MNGFVQWMEVELMPITNKFGSQRHMTTTRKGLTITMPLTIMGSFFTIFQNIPIEAYAKLIESYQTILGTPSRYTMGLPAFYTTLGVTSSLAKSHKLDSLACGILVLMASPVTAAPSTRVFEDVDNVITARRYTSLVNLGSASLFGAIVTALLPVETYCFFIGKDIMTKMPDGVPPEVSNLFIALIPGAATPLLFQVIRRVVDFDLSGSLSTLLMPLKGIFVGNSLFGGLLAVFLVCFFRVLGAHGPAIIGPIIHPFWDMSITEDLEAFINGVNTRQLPNTFTEQFSQWSIWAGGAGTTPSLIVLIMFSKSIYLESLGRLSFLPGLLNINEPVILGTLIVMNPILGTPFIVAPLVTAMLSYSSTVADITPMMAVHLTFTVLAPIAVWMSTNWSFSVTILVIVSFLITIAVYYPFFGVYEKQQLDKEAEELAAEQAVKSQKVLGRVF